jgi:hypothetical protein
VTQNEVFIPPQYATLCNLAEISLPYPLSGYL